jgi:hypothetical protein
VREDWEMHLPRKSSSCTSSLKAPLVQDGSEQSICHRLNSHASSNSDEELLPVPISNHPNGTSLLSGRTGAKEQGKPKPLEAHAAPMGKHGNRQVQGVPARFRALPVEALTHRPYGADASPITS